VCDRYNKPPLRTSTESVISKQSINKIKNPTQLRDAAATAAAAAARQHEQRNKTRTLACSVRFSVSSPASFSRRPEWVSVDRCSL
jgi:hypothetical protein